METSTYPNWFATTAEDNFAAHLLPLAGQPVRCLQIGVFAGNASVWLLENVLTGPRALLADVDTWEGSPELSDWDFADVERAYDDRMRDYPQVHKFKGSSESFFALFHGCPPFDFIYVDAAHDACSALNDLVGAYRLLKPGGLLAVDDYNWSAVGMAVDAFAACYGDRLEWLESSSAQAWFRRAA